MGVLLRSHLAPKLHAISIKGLEGERVDIREGVERADTMAKRRIEVVEGRIDVGGALFLDETTEGCRVETRVEILLQDTRPDCLLVKDGGLENGTGGCGGCLGSEDRGDKRGMYRSDSHATEATPKGTVAEPGRSGKVLLCIWGEDRRGRGSGWGGCKCGSLWRRHRDGGQLGRRGKVGEGATLEETFFECSNLLAEGDVF